MVSREEIAYVTCTCINEPDFLATIDLDPRSPCYGQVTHRLPVSKHKDKDVLHASGFSLSCPNRNNKLILPCLTSSRIYVVDVGSGSLVPKISKVIELENKSYLNTPRKLPNGDILIANMGDPDGNGKGGFIVLEKETFKPKRPWEDDSHHCRSVYDFWIQPRYNVVVSSDGFIPKSPGKFDPNDFGKGIFGRNLCVWDLSSKTLQQTFDLGEDSLPLSVRFLHNPDAAEGYVACALSGVVYRIFKCESESWAVEEVIRIPPKEVTGWIMRKMPAFITNIIISPDDKYLYLCNWLHGDIRQYKLSRNCKPQLVGQVFVGGSILRGGSVSVSPDEELNSLLEPLVVKCKRVYGGPAQMQIGLDGNRLCVTNSFFSTWDRQFYPDMVREGSVMLLIDVDTEKGGLTVNKNFLVDFGKEPYGPVLACDIHFATGDATTQY